MPRALNDIDRMYRRWRNHKGKVQLRFEEGLHEAAVIKARIEGKPIPAVAVAVEPVKPRIVRERLPIIRERLDEPVLLEATPVSPPVTITPDDDNPEILVSVSRSTVDHVMGYTLSGMSSHDKSNQRVLSRTIQQATRNYNQ